MIDNQPTVLFIDDEMKMLEIITDILNSRGYRTIGVTQGREALQVLETENIDVVFLDLRLYDMDGFEVLKAIKKEHGDIPVVIISAYGDIPTAVRTTQQGAVDFLPKPLDSETLLPLLDRLLTRRMRDLERESENEKLFQKFGLIGTSPAMRHVYSLIETAAPTDASVFIQGETGTGKELAAQALHKLSHRAQYPFIAVNCSALPKDLIESELFGYVKGAFTGATRNNTGKIAAADGGTLFLDEIADMDPSTQAKLLRVLEDKKIQPLGTTESFSVDIRLISATNQHLQQKIRAGQFREDLFYRLHVVRLVMPTLAQRREDIPLLIQHFIDHYCQAYQRPKKQFSPAALESLVGRDWPGNVRELKNIAEKLAIFVQNSQITPPDIHLALEMQGLAAVKTEHLSLAAARKRFERDYILTKLIVHEWNMTAAANAMGIERTNLHRKIKALGIEKPFRKDSDRIKTAGSDPVV